MLGYLGHMWELYAMWTWVVVFAWSSLAAAGVGNVAAAGSFAAFLAIGSGAAGCVMAGYIADRAGKARVAMWAMIGSAACSALTVLVYGGPPLLLYALIMVWGFAVVADSAQFSTMVTELADQAYVGTALTLQLALGFTLTIATIWLIPILEDAFGWRWAFAFLAPGPALGVVAMLRLKSLPEASRIAGGRG
jgi:MFS family permease